jgi:membrane-bound lytic murein transglycosylase B
VRIPGGRPALTTFEVVRPRLTRFTRTPVVGILAIAALMVVGAVGAAPGPATLGHPQVHDGGVRPLAAVAIPPGDVTGATVVPVTRPPTSFHFAAATLSAPPPPIVVNSPGALRIPAIALAAYRNAERLMAAADPACGVSWNLLAGIGRIESMHANGGATDAHGNALRPILGPLLDGSLPGNEIIVQSRGPYGVQYARALGPMQFLPGTWARFASDGDGDGRADVQNVFDASLAAARYLCSGGLNLRDPMQAMAAVLRYNNSMPYAENVLGWAAAYATGVVPVDLPPITGPIPPMGDAHLEGAPEGIGPGMPINAIGLPPTDPLALLPVQFGRTDIANELDPGALAAGQYPGESPTCVLTCLGPQPVMAPGPFAAPLPGPASAFGQLPGPAAFTQSPLPGPAQTGGAPLLGPAPFGQPSPAGPFPAGPSPAGPFPAGPSPAGPFPAGPSPAGPLPAGPPQAGPASTGQPAIAGPGGADAPTPDAPPDSVAPMPGATVTPLPAPTLPAEHGPLPGPAGPLG